MDPVRTAVRVLLAYVFVLVLLRVSGRRTVRQGDVPSFVVALVIGDMFDGFFWGEIPAAQFAVGVGTLMTTHLLAGVGRFHSGLRTWRERAGGDGVQARRTR
jgi:uncharacterized membrane protein YcaP (DUF421 family)